MGARRNAAARRSAPSALAALVALAALAALAGCGSSSDSEPAVRFTMLEPSQPAAPPPANPKNTVKSLVLRAQSLEIGTLPRGRLLSVFGEVSETGWYLPELTPRRDGLPGPDGFLEFDFVAAPPQMNGQEAPPVGTSAQRRIRADLPLDATQLSGAIGVRVFAEAGPLAYRFPVSESDGDAASGLGTGG